MPNPKHLVAQGHDNYAFEMEAPKSPWRYPHLVIRDSFRNTNKMSVKFRQPGDNFPSPANGHGHHHMDMMGVRAHRWRLSVSSRHNVSENIHQRCTNYRLRSVLFFQHLRRADSKDSTCSSMAMPPQQSEFMNLHYPRR